MHLNNATQQHLVALVLDAMAGKDAVHHGNEDLILAVELRNKRSERIHGNTLQFGGRVKSAHKWVNDAGCVISQVKRVGELVD